MKVPTKVFRPHLDDVENLSYGKAAKKQRGTGSRSICHRLNKNERKIYELAKQAGYLSVRGTGYRKNRKGSPLYNIYRQRCDALESICVIVEKFTDGDLVLIDFSTLRVFNDDAFVSAILENVLKVKHPDLYLEVTNVTDHGENDSKHCVSKTSLTSKNAIDAPIDWEAILTKPIWGVNERLITVLCARDTAKALALDVLKESQNFDLLSVVSHLDESKEESLGCCNDGIIEMAEQVAGEDNSVNTIDNGEREADDDDSSIDWDDI